jgi:hypothetical protein
VLVVVIDDAAVFVLVVEVEDLKYFVQIEHDLFEID